jgi:hypothetical protein
MASVHDNLIKCLELACQSQRAEQLVRGRELVGEYIATLGIEIVERHAYDHLRLEGDREFRRLAEIYALHSREALKRLVEFGLGSKNPRIVAAAMDFVDDKPDDSENGSQPFD